MEFRGPELVLPSAIQDSVSESASTTNKNVQNTITAPKPKTDQCKNEGCSRKPLICGLCRACRYPCKFKGCTSRQQISGYCKRHAQRKTCTTKGCKNKADVHSNICRKCKNPCAFEGCSEGKQIGEYCMKHSQNSCSNDGCENKAFTKTGHCRKCAYPCILEGCSEGKQVGDYCHAHANLPACSTHGCENKSQTIKGLCKACMYPCIVDACKAEKKFGNYCPRHANVICTKCKNRVAYYQGQNNTYICQACSNPCDISGCEAGAEHSPRNTGIKGRCKKHGGGDRCEGACCKIYEMPTVAAHRHPETNQGMCRAWAQNMVADLRFKGKYEEARDLMTFFGLKREIAYRGEHAFYWAMCKMLPGLNDLNMFQIALDMPASFLKNRGLPKNMKDYRPDYFHVFREGSNPTALLGEFDEDDSHEDCVYRLRDISLMAGIPIERIFVYRINARQGTDDALFEMRQRRNVKFAEILDRGENLAKIVVSYLAERIDDIKNGILPDIVPGEFNCVYFYHHDGEVIVDKTKRRVP